MGLVPNTAALPPHGAMPAGELLNASASGPRSAAADVVADHAQVVRVGDRHCRHACRVHKLEDAGDPGRDRRIGEPVAGIDTHDRWRRAIDERRRHAIDLSAACLVRIERRT
jgi:hypothetical protein